MSKENGGQALDWTLLGEVHRLAKESGVSYSLNYCEADDSWYFAVDSIAPSEQWIGKNHSFHIAVECVIEWLRAIQSSERSKP